VPDNLEALRTESRRISAVAAELSEEAFATPTRLPPWTIKDVLAHLLDVVDAVNVGLAEFPPAVVDGDAVSYWRSYDPDEDAAETSARATERAATYATGAALAEAWDALRQRTIQAITPKDGTRPIATGGPVLTLDEFLKTRVLEVTIHGLDMAAALGRPPWATAPALAVTREIMVGLLGIRPPADLEWDAVTFLETGAGRRSLTPRERGLLGEVSTRFPLLT
jgi:uncharacterized protein (TIGR03083 family)